MLLNSKEMTGVPVETRAGYVVGKVASFHLDASTGRLVSMLVHAPGIVSGLFRDELVVAWDAILEMTPDRVLVADAAVKVTARLARKEFVTPVPNPTMMRDAE